MSMSAQLAYEQILYESAANEATGEVWLKKGETIYVYYPVLCI